MHLPARLSPLLRSPVALSINRDGEFGTAPPGGKDFYRVVLVGGSAAFCGTLGDGRSLSAILQQHLRSPESLRALKSGNAHVGCIANSGIDSSGLRLVVEKILPQYTGIDLLIIMCGHSDVLRWLLQGAPDGQPPTPITVEGCFRCEPSRRFRWSPRETALVALYRRIKPLLHRGPASIHVGKYNLRELEDRAQVTTFTPLTQDFSGMVLACERNFRAALKLAKTKARRIIIVEVTGSPPQNAEQEKYYWNGRIGAPSNSSPPSFISTEDLLRLIAEVDRVVRNIAHECGVEYFPVNAILNRVPSAYYDHFHLTEEGARELGEALAASVVAPLATEARSAL